MGRAKTTETKKRPLNQVDVKFYTEPPTISLEEAAEKTKRQKSAIHQAVAMFELNFAEIGMHGKRIVVDDLWLTFEKKCKGLDKDKKKKQSNP